MDPSATIIPVQVFPSRRSGCDDAAEGEDGLYSQLAQLSLFTTKAEGMGVVGFPISQSKEAPSSFSDEVTGALEIEEVCIGSPLEYDNGINSPRLCPADDTTLMGSPPGPVDCRYCRPCCDCIEEGEGKGKGKGAGGILENTDKCPYLAGLNSMLLEGEREKDPSIETKRQNQVSNGAQRTSFNVDEFVQKLEALRREEEMANDDNAFGIIVDNGLNSPRVFSPQSCFSPTQGSMTPAIFDDIKFPASLGFVEDNTYSPRRRQRTKGLQKDTRRLSNRPNRPEKGGRRGQSKYSRSVAETGSSSNGAKGGGNLSTRAFVSAKQGGGNRHWVWVPKTS